MFNVFTYKATFTINPTPLLGEGYDLLWGEQFRNKTHPKHRHRYTADSQLNKDGTELRVATAHMVEVIRGNFTMVR